MIKYRDNMSAEETAQLLAEANALDAAYASAAAHDAATNPPEDWGDWEDEMEYWSKAGLSRGQP